MIDDLPVVPGAGRVYLFELARSITGPREFRHRLPRRHRSRRIVPEPAAWPLLAFASVLCAWLRQRCSGEPLNLDLIGQ